MSDAKAAISVDANASIWGLFKQAGEFCQANWKLLLQLAALSAACGILTSFILRANDVEVINNPLSFIKDQNTASVKQMSDGVEAVISLTTLVGVVVSFLAYIMLSQFVLLAGRGHKVQSMGQLWEQTRPLLRKVITVQLLTGLFVLGGLILLIIPGIILALWYCYSPVVRMEQPELSARQAMNKSKELIQANKSLVLWWIIGSLVVAIGLSIVIAIVGSLISVVPYLGNVVNGILAEGLSVFLVVTALFVYLTAKANTKTVPKQEQ